ncbi:MAG: corrinoid protein [Deltaproteobacteria bacterium]|nr:corrinoid protein [Deltaproteobacteria bacterium]MBW1736406.1 corrinoid protein [Deltaproteobacteria bacterium]MBW1908293.1 corrinoid protein [Deltaproteobacteria bacterium]MBW2033239.1 corrinoid protein [Deltaproteobacteria bacterium]MBW2113284.1 corrinoid protein [Deltaproteobacteria bacterium]
MSEHLDKIKEAVISGKHAEIEVLVKGAIEDKADLGQIITDGMVAAMDIVGQRFAKSEIFIPEMLVSAVTMKKGLEIIKPLLKGDEIESKGTIIMCTVKGDIHDIGKNLVIMMLQGAGFDVIDLGVDMSTEELAQKVEEIRPDILGLSALLTTTMPEIKNVIETLKDKGLRNSIKIMVGGAPLNVAFAGKVGADGYAEDAAEAVMLARSLIEAK